MSHTSILELSSKAAKKHFLKATSYLNADLPSYLSFQIVLDGVSEVLDGEQFAGFQNKQPSDLDCVNYRFDANKDGRFSWRPYELIHPVIYVSLVNLICKPKNWKLLKKRFAEFESGIVRCCSRPVVSTDGHSDVAAQVSNWWQSIEQRSLEYSLEFSHVLHTDVVDCYGSIYTHSISWAIHGMDLAKDNKTKKTLLGNQIDFHVRSGRFGQTNGIPQGSVLMDFVAELVLGWVDEQIDGKLGDEERQRIRILRYRDDYRIFANSDLDAERALKIISDCLRIPGMKLGHSKTFLSRNVVEGSIKPDKLAGIDLQDLGKQNAKTIQKQLLRLHSFGQRFPNSGALRRLLSEFAKKLKPSTQMPDDLDTQVAIATDIGFVSPATFPAIAKVLSHLISKVSDVEEKLRLWNLVRGKIQQLPYNGYLEVWLQRVIQPSMAGELDFESAEALCKVANGESPTIWNNDWISKNKKLTKALDVTKIKIGDVDELGAIVESQEIDLFAKLALQY